MNDQDWIDDIPLDDDLQLDLLVDNELNEERRQRLLTHLEGTPDRWRAVALRFVESQMLTGVVERLTGETKSAQPAIRNNIGSPRRPYGLQMMLTSAALCLAFLVGTLINVDPVRNRPGLAENPVRHQSAGSRINGAARPRTSRMTARSRRTVRPFLLRNVRVPLRQVVMPSGQSGWAPRVRLSKSEQLAMRQSGLTVQRRPGVMRVPFGDDRHVLMPAEHVRVVPQSRHRI